MDLPIDPYECERCRFIWQSNELRLCPWHKARLGVGVLTHPRQLNAALEQRERRLAPGYFDMVPERAGAAHRSAQGFVTSAPMRRDQEPASSLVDELDL